MNRGGLGRQGTGAPGASRHRQGERTQPRPSLRAAAPRSPAATSSRGRAPTPTGRRRPMSSPPIRAARCRTSRRRRRPPRRRTRRCWRCAICTSASARWAAPPRCCAGWSGLGSTPFWRSNSSSVTTLFSSASLRSMAPLAQRLRQDLLGCFCGKHLHLLQRCEHSTISLRILWLFRCEITNIHHKLTVIHAGSRPILREQSAPAIIGGRNSTIDRKRPQYARENPLGDTEHRQHRPGIG